MKIKLAILETDQTYLNRIVTVFSTRYPDKFEIYSFTDQAFALENLNSSRIDVLVASDIFDIDVNLLPKRCGFAYFVESADVDTVREQQAICKFQKADLIYKQILSIYSENAGNMSGLKLGNDNTVFLLFISPSGGAGTSSMAAACAIHFAQQNKKVLYLNLETLGSSDAFFQADGGFDMSDIIYVLKSRKANLAMKLESCVRQDSSGVYFFSQPKLALDMLELVQEDIEHLVSELKLTGTYDYIIGDADFSMSRQTLDLCRTAHATVWVGDGSEISNLKIQRAYQAISIIEQNADAPLTDRLCLIYNKFSNKTSKSVGEMGLRTIDGAPRYEHASTTQVLEQLAAKNMFDHIL